MTAPPSPIRIAHAPHPGIGASPVDQQQQPPQQPHYVIYPLSMVRAFSAAVPMPNGVVAYVPYVGVHSTASPAGCVPEPAEPGCALFDTTTTTMAGDARLQ